MIAFSMRRTPVREESQKNDRRYVLCSSHCEMLNRSNCLGRMAHKVLEEAFLMSLLFTRPEVLSLRNHPEFSEKWVQDLICSDPSILGLGEVELVAAEKLLPRAGRLDLILHDDQLNRRYEVELMLGATDPSHIIRCIEYWDVERRRYPAYDHVALLVVEDITSRFLNVMALLAGSIPMMALQMTALKVDDKIVLHFARVLDQTTLRSDDEYELGERAGGGAADTDRAWWEQRSKSSLLAICDEILQMVTEITGQPHRMRYRKKVIDLVAERDDNRRIWCQPKKTMVHVGAYLAQPEAWVKRFEDAGLPATLRRGNKAARTTLTPDEFKEQKPLLREFIQDATVIQEGE